MQKVIVTTTINPPTEAIAKYDAIPDWNLIVVGDRQSPPKYKLRRGTFISWQDQQKRYPNFCELIGPDSVARGRMIAFVEAHRRKADIVASIDDDCMPFDDWGKQLFLGKSVKTSMSDDFILDPMAPFSDWYWHRGFPLERTWDRHHVRWAIQAMRPKIQANFSTGQADLDAMHRIGRTPQVLSYDPAKLPFGVGYYSPINTQNTFILGKYLKDHFGNIPFIGRADDIWAGFMFQRAHRGATIYGQADTEHVQNRAHSSVISDFKNEFYLYERNWDFLYHLNEYGVDAAMDRFLPAKAKQAIALYRSYFK